MKKLKTTAILVITLLFFYTTHSQTKEQIGQWLNDSLKIKTYFNVNYANIANNIETTFYVDYNLQKDVFTFYFAETKTHQVNREKTNSVKIVQIYSEDIVYQNVNGLKLVSVRTPYKQSTPVYGVYQLLLREGAFVNVYEDNTLKDIKETPSIQDIFKSWSYYSKSYKVASEKISKENDEYNSVLKINDSEYFDSTYIDLLNQLDDCFEKNGNDNETCKEIANTIDHVFKKMPNIIIKNDDTYLYEAGNALQWMFEFCKPKKE